MLAAEGAHVVVNDLGGEIDGSGATLGPANEVVEEIKGFGGSAISNGDDVSSWEGAQRLINAAVETFGGLHAVVNNAGILRDRMLTNMTEEEWDAVIRVHLKGTFAPSRWAAAYWRDEFKAGNAVDARIINTSSVSGLYGNPGQTNDGAAKAGIALFTFTAALELAEYLRIHPRWVESTATGGSAPEVQLEHAATAVAAGVCDVAVVSFASTNATMMARANAGRSVGSAFASNRPAGEMGEWEHPYGIGVPVVPYALAAARHMYQFGTTSEQLARALGRRCLRPGRSLPFRTVGPRRRLRLRSFPWRAPSVVERALDARVRSNPARHEARAQRSLPSGWSPRQVVPAGRVGNREIHVEVFET